MSVPFLSARHVYAALDPGEAVEAVREAFVAHAHGEWFMPSKVYVPAPPDGDFRAMPAAGAGHAVLKWVTSFPGNPARGLPTVSGVVLLSDGATGELRALLDAGAVTALRTGAAAVLAAETLGVQDGGPAAVVGCGVNGGPLREPLSRAAVRFCSGTLVAVRPKLSPKSSARTSWIATVRSPPTSS